MIKLSTDVKDSGLIIINIFAQVFHGNACLERTEEARKRLNSMLPKCLEHMQNKEVLHFVFKRLKFTGLNPCQQGKN